MELGILLLVQPFGLPTIIPVVRYPVLQVLAANPVQVRVVQVSQVSLVLLVRQVVPVCQVNPVNQALQAILAAANPVQVNLRKAVQADLRSQALLTLELSSGQADKV